MAEAGWARAAAAMATVAAARARAAAARVTAVAARAKAGLAGPTVATRAAPSAQTCRRPQTSGRRLPSPQPGPPPWHRSSPAGSRSPQCTRKWATARGTEQMQLPWRRRCPARRRRRAT
eukprot:scaffold4514_cov62-Phaeocystis_antarctica.AAC.6